MEITLQKEMTLVKIMSIPGTIVYKIFVGEFQSILQYYRGKSMYGGLFENDECWGLFMIYLRLSYCNKTLKLTDEIRRFLRDSIVKYEI